MKISNDLQNIYNQYLRISRTSANKPFKLRKDFSKFDDDKFVYLTRISNLFKRFPNVDRENYFKAPFELYDDGRFDLDYFSTMKAVKSYTVYCNKLDYDDPDSEYHIKFIIDSLRHVGKYCHMNKISIGEYFTERIGLTYTWMKDYNTRNISIYFLMAFPQVYDIMKGEEEDVQELMMRDLEEKYVRVKMKYNSSKKAKKMLIKGISLLHSKLSDKSS